jgi:hypothetical protein
VTAYLDPAVGFVTTAQPADDPAGQVDLLADPAAAATYWRQSGPNVDVGRNPSGVPYPGGLRSLQYTATRRARLVFPGVTGNYCSVPNAANLQITGDIEVVVRCSLTDWTPVTIQTLVSRDGIPGGGAPAGSRSWSTRIHTTGQILFLMSADGTAGPTQVSSAVIPFTDGAMGWLKITRVATSGLVSFYSAPDSITEPTSWTARSTATINAGINLPAGNAAVGIGQRQTLEPLNGRIARAIVRNGIAGTTVLDVSENNAGTMTDATHFQATTGQTVTVTQTAGNTIVQPQPDSLVWRFDAADYPGTGLTYTDPRSRTWTLSAAGAITAP